MEGPPKAAAAVVVGTGWVYEAGPLTPFYTAWAYATLGPLFFITLFYWAVIPAWAWVAWRFAQGWTLVAVLTLALTTPLWAGRSGAWAWFARGRGFEAWRRYFAFRVHKSHPLPSKSNVILAAFPHGLFPFGLPCVAGVVEQVFPELGEVALARVARAR